jgi:hypothetical protein
MTGDHKSLDLTGALINLGDLRISKESLDRALPTKPCATMHLKSHSSGIVGDLGSTQLGHRRFPRMRKPSVLEKCCTSCQ